MVNAESGVLEPVDTRGGPGCVHGLFQMLGNAPEWTVDRYLAYPGYIEPEAKTGDAPVIIPMFDPSLRVARGGGALLPQTFATSCSRHGIYPAVPHGVRGVRSESPGPEGGGD